MRRMLSLLALLALSAGAAAAQDAWTRGAAERLHLVLSRDGREGARLLPPPAAGTLYEEGLAERTMTLEPGAYLVVAACDSACADVDVRVLDDAGRVMGEDVDRHPHALADVDVTRAGSYRVRVTMVSCAAQPCAYAAGVYRVEP